MLRLIIRDVAPVLRMMWHGVALGYENQFTFKERIFVLTYSMVQDII
jgi:hypothetical protein